MAHASLLTWNIERRAPATWQAATLMSRIAREAPDVVCLTEAWAGSTVALNGHELAVRGPRWAWDQHDDERLVVLWSVGPWREVTVGGDKDARAGGIICAVTDTPLGSLQVIGLCSPSHTVSPVDAPAKAKMWTEQMRFWRGLSRILADRVPGLPTVVLGDFNQFIPRVWGKKAAHVACMTALDGPTVATAGDVRDAEKAAIDHIAHTPDLEAFDVRALSRFADDGRALSDHFGVTAKVAAHMRTS